MLIALIVVAAIGGLVLLALAIVLFVQLRRVSVTVAALNRELLPVLEALRRDAQLARDRLQELSDRYAPSENPRGAGSGTRR
jgi:hypothetical protein